MWYVAHAIIYFKYKDVRQKKFPLWENVYLLAALSEEEAWKKARELAQLDAGDDNGSLRCDGHAAMRVFAGIRKLVTLIDEEGPRDGIEITFSELEVKSEADIQALAKGEAAVVHYEKVKEPE